MCLFWFAVVSLRFPFFVLCFPPLSSFFFLPIILSHYISFFSLTISFFLFFFSFFFFHCFALVCSFVFLCYLCFALQFIFLSLLCFLLLLWLFSFIPFACFFCLFFFPLHCYASVSLCFLPLPSFEFFDLLRYYILCRCFFLVFLVSFCFAFSLVCFFDSFLGSYFSFLVMVDFSFLCFSLGCRHLFFFFPFPYLIFCFAFLCFLFLPLYSLPFFSFRYFVFLWIFLQMSTTMGTLIRHTNG